MIKTNYENRWKYSYAMTHHGKTLSIIGLFFSKNMNGYGIKEITLILMNFSITIYWGIK